MPKKNMTSGFGGRKKKLPRYKPVSTNVAPPGGSSADPGTPVGTVSTTPAAARRRVKVRSDRKRAFGDRARKAFKAEYGDEWKQRVFGSQAGNVKSTFGSGVGNTRSVWRRGTPGGDSPAAPVRKTADQLNRRFLREARRLGVKPPRF